jgi:two-component system NarL family sensor kinase
MRGSSAAPPTFARTFFQHVGIGLVVLAAVASVATLVSVRTGREQALRRPVAGGESVASRIVAPLVTQGVYDGNTRDLIALNGRVRLHEAGSAIERIKVWSANGVILYSDDPRQIGLRYPLDSDRSRALTSQRVESTVADLTRSRNVLDRPLGQSLEVSAGTRDTSGRPILVQTYYAVDRLDADEATLIRRMVALVLVSLLGFGLLFVPLAYSLARRASRVNGNGRTRPAGPGTS